MMDQDERMMVRIRLGVKYKVFCILLYLNTLFVVFVFVFVFVF